MEVVPLQEEEDVLKCQFHQWFHDFRHFTIKSEILPLSEDFISYLLEDGVYLPKLNSVLPLVTDSKHNIYDDDDDDDDDDDEDENKWDENEDDSDEPELPSFFELEKQISESITRLGGFIFPKLNWSSPKDAKWLSPNKNIRCSNFEEIFLFLKSSDAVVHDICHAFENCKMSELKRPEKFMLVLRKWINVLPDTEFRCFVRNCVLVGISQRHVSEFFPSIIERKNEIKKLIFQFYHEHVVHKFHANNFTFDVYVKGKKVIVIDFNPYGASTLPFLFTWNDLEEIYSHILHRYNYKSSKPPSSSLSSASSSLTSSSSFSSSSSSSLPLLHSNETNGNNISSGKNGNCRNGERFNDCLDKSNIVSNDNNQDRESNGYARSDKAQNDCIHCGNDSSNNYNNLNHEVLFDCMELRMVMSSKDVDNMICPSSQFGYGVPLDLVDVSPGSAIDEFMKNAMIHDNDV